MHRVLVLLACAALLIADEAPADLGSPAPSLTGATWHRGAAPAVGTAYGVVFFTHLDGLQQPALHLAPAELPLVLLAEEADGLTAHLAERPGPAAVGVATPQILARWLGPSAVPAAALVGADGLLLWRGRVSGLDGAWRRERAGGWPRERLQAVTRLRAQLRAALLADPGTGTLPAALVLTGKILALEPIDEEALRLRLDLARHLGEREAFRDTLAALPVAELPADLANELAWARATDADLSWRHPELALNLVEHARRQEPADAAIEDTYARVLYLLGLLDDAVAAQLRAVSLDPRDEVLRHTLDYYREVQALREERRRATPLPER